MAAPCPQSARRGGGHAPPPRCPQRLPYTVQASTPWRVPAAPPPPPSPPALVRLLGAAASIGWSAIAGLARRPTAGGCRAPPPRPLFPRCWRGAPPRRRRRRHAGAAAGRQEESHHRHPHPAPPPPTPCPIISGCTRARGRGRRQGAWPACPTPRRDHPCRPPSAPPPP